MTLYESEKGRYISTFSGQDELDGDDLEGTHPREIDSEGVAGGARDTLVGDGEVVNFALEDLQEDRVRLCP